ncbi:hypothetical protein TNIN_376121 [Trichonephila inaurata madagascariensis]|uniref:EMI domain-containing protein n=1 Tax=Trichonephila inaurata madagascariensis TaxID=2747483 RepID=A0A8X7CIE7_9ARAC|nr:hypothetical protein TNIN_376121 [Trichonephila inaurata madagascariensis]
MTAVSSVRLTEEGVCSALRKVKVTKMVSYMASYERRYTTWCFSLPPRCTRYRTDYTRKYKIVTEDLMQTEFSCCLGYKLHGAVCKRAFYLYSPF